MVQVIRLKLLRKSAQNFGLGLKGAKDLVDEYFRSGNIVGIGDGYPDYPELQEPPF